MRKRCGRFGFVTLLVPLLVPCRSVVLPFDTIVVESSDRPAFVMFTPSGCTNPVCQAIAPNWNEVGRSFPGIVWRADCVKGAEASAPICGRAAVDGVAFLVWNGQTWDPFKGERSIQSLYESVRFAHQLLVRSYSEQLGALFRTLLSEMRGEPRMLLLPQSGTNARSVTPGPSGVIEMPHDGLPTWFRCGAYTLVSEGATALDVLSSPGVYFAGEPHRLPWWKPWKFHWQLQSANASSIEFLWHSEGLGAETDSVQHHVSINAEHSRRAPLRHCELLITLPRVPALFDSRDSEADAERMEAEPASRTLGLTLDATLAYDWMRFQYIGWAEAFGRRIRSHLHSQRTAGAPVHGRELVFYDGMCGSAWFPAVLRTQLPDARFYLSDLSVDAIALARRNLESNEFSATFLHGDLFAPMREVISHDRTARPHYVYLYPPQSPRLPPEMENDPRLVPQPRVSVQTPTTSVHFFHRFAAELVDILAPGAIVWVGIDLDIADEGRRIFEAAGWRVQAASVLAPELLGMSNPATLLELTWPQIEQAGSQAHHGHGSVSIHGDW